MKDRYILIKLQERFKKGGYVLVAPNSGRVYAYGRDIEILYKKILTNKIPSTRKHIMFVPRADVRYVV